MFKTWGTVLAVAVVLVMSGCSAALEPSAESAPVEVAASATPEAAPIVAEPAPVESSNPDWGDLTQDEFYLAGLKDTWQTAPPTAEQQLAAGRYVCEQLTAGVQRADIVAMSGETAEAKADNTGIVSTAIYVLCPEFEG